MALEKKFPGLKFLLAVRSQFGRFELLPPVFDVNFTNCAFEVPDAARNYAICSLLGATTFRIDDAGNPFLLELPPGGPLDLEALCTRRLEPLWSESSQKFIPSAIRFRPDQRVHVRPLLSTAIWGRVLEGSLSVVLNPSGPWRLPPRVALTLKKWKPTNVVACLDMMETLEVLDAANLYECRNCGRRVRAQQQTFIWVPPQVFVLQLNRFASNGRKDEREVAFDEVLDMSRFARGVREDVRYRLLGVIHYAGTLESGHYKAFCRVTDEWYRFDDKICRKASFAEARTAGAYMLFYVKM